MFIEIQGFPPLALLFHQTAGLQLRAWGGGEGSKRTHNYRRGFWGHLGPSAKGAGRSAVLLQGFSMGTKCWNGTEGPLGLPPSCSTGVAVAVGQS